MKRRFFLSLLIGFFLGRSCAFSATAPIPKNINDLYPPLKTTLPPISSIHSVPSPVVPQPVDFGVCNKFFKLDSQKLFYLTLAGVNANRFVINEIQSKSGYVLFSVGQKQFLASIINIDAKNSMLKITPCNNIYYFPIGVVQNMFKYIDLNINTPIEKLSIL